MTFLFIGTDPPPSSLLCRHRHHCNDTPWKSFSASTSKCVYKPACKSISLQPTLWTIKREIQNVNVVQSIINTLVYTPVVCCTTKCHLLYYMLGLVKWSKLLFPFHEDFQNVGKWCQLGRCVISQDVYIHEKRCIAYGHACIEISPTCSIINLDLIFVTKQYVLLYIDGWDELDSKRH